MNRQQLIQQIKEKRSYLCVGLDTDITKIPDHLKKEKDPVVAFNKQIIEATHECCVAYKPNLAFYEAMGPIGWERLMKTLELIPDTCFTIADAKRGDIGNTSLLYAHAFFEQMNFDAITVAPYMGEDSVKPFLEFKDKWVILLAHTSNPSSSDFQQIESRASGKKLYEEVIAKACTWATPDQLMFVVGATQADKLKVIRELSPSHFYLVPGVGAQGGSLTEVSKNGMNNDCGLLVNASRSILYASSGNDFAKSAAAEAKKLQQEMEQCLSTFTPLLG